MCMQLVKITYSGKSETFRLEYEQNREENIEHESTSDSGDRENEHSLDDDWDEDVLTLADTFRTEIRNIRNRDHAPRQRREGSLEDDIEI